MNEPVESPCVEICQIDQAMGLCRGCFRTLDEIARWGRLSAAERRVIMQSLPARKNDLSDNPPNI